MLLKKYIEIVLPSVDVVYRFNVFNTSLKRKRRNYENLGNRLKNYSCVKFLSVFFFFNNNNNDIIISISLMKDVVKATNL